MTLSNAKSHWKLKKTLDVKIVRLPRSQSNTIQYKHNKSLFSYELSNIFCLFQLATSFNGSRIAPGDFKISISSGNMFLFSSFKNTIAVPSSPNLDGLPIRWMYSLIELGMSNTITCLTPKRSTPRPKTPVVLNLCCYQSYDAPRTQPLYGRG